MHLQPVPAYARPLGPSLGPSEEKGAVVRLPAIHGRGLRVPVVQTAVGAVLELQAEDHDVLQRFVHVAHRASHGGLYGLYLAAHDAPHQVEMVASHVMQHSPALGVPAIRPGDLPSHRAADLKPELAALDVERPPKDALVDEPPQVPHRRMEAPGILDEGRQLVPSDRPDHVVEVFRGDGELLVHREVLPGLRQLEQSVRQVTRVEHHGRQVEVLSRNQVLHAGVQPGGRVVPPGDVEERGVVQLAVGDDLHVLEAAEVVDQPRLRVVEAAGVSDAEPDVRGPQGPVLSHTTSPTGVGPSARRRRGYAPADPGRCCAGRPA